MFKGRECNSLSFGVLHRLTFYRVSRSIDALSGLGPCLRSVDKKIVVEMQDSNK